MVVPITDSLGVRLGRGDRGLYDSLIVAWQRHTDFAERRSIEGRLHHASGGSVLVLRTSNGWILVDSGSWIT